MPKGELIYMNNQLYSLLECQSEQVLGKPMKETVIPKSIIHIYELAIKRRSKIENEEVVIEKHQDEQDSGGKENGKEKEDEKEKEQQQADNGENAVEEEPIFKGHATVIPIRGKENSLDYYLMVLSTEVIV